MKHIVTFCVFLMFLFFSPYLRSQSSLLGKGGKKIVLQKSAVGLANVDNTADVNKPISTATQAAINLKENIANKSTNLTTDTSYPTVKAVKDYADGINTSSIWWKFGGNTGTSQSTPNFLGTTDNADLVFKTNNVERMRILGSNGNIGIGTSTPQANVHVLGSVQITETDVNTQKESQILTCMDPQGYANWNDPISILQYGLIGYYDNKFNTVVAPIVSATGRVWMDRNLGALQRPQNINDFLSYGQLYQWGRGNDGHADVSWKYDTGSYTIMGTFVNGITTTRSDDPIDGKYVISGNDWRVSPNDNLWQGVNGINNPCPYGYRVPTTAEFEVEVAQYNITDFQTAFSNNPLRFLAPFGANYADGSIVINNAPYSASYYWTSIGYGMQADELGFTSFDNVQVYNGLKGSGAAIRCIKD